ncbi:MAG: hypothetical protein KatS3mg129_0839 [Leptospiraceae bacterium]|nr:MAG: hypothetical protein KatS3mg129_0839 [Leptospiraceae bacterium]
MSNLIWILEENDSTKFPYKLIIRDEDKKENKLVLYTQDRWPGQKGKIFCIREKDLVNQNEQKKVLEKVPIIAYIQKNNLISIILDRYKNKRCDFLFLKKKYKNKEGEYEQIFWRTQIGLLNRHTRSKLTKKISLPLQVAIDKNEKYPWQFSDIITIKKKLPVGDYALIENDEILSIVERKTFDNLIHDFKNLNIFHKQLYELETYKHSALVIEANYSDFLNPKYVKFFKVSYIASLIANLFYQHPNLKIIFAGNRKLAIEWTINYFKEIKKNYIINQQSSLWNTGEKDIVYYKNNFKGGLYYEIKFYILNHFKSEDYFNLKVLYNHFSYVDKKIVYNQVQRLLRENLLERTNKKGYYKIKSINT